MLKKLSFMALSLMLFSGVAFSATADNDDVGSDVVGYTVSDVYVTRITSNGHILNQSGTGQLGSPNYPWKKIYTSSGITNHNELFVDLAAKSKLSILQSLVISSAQLVSGGTTWITGDFTQPVVPRNIVVVTSISVDGVGMTTVTVTGTALVYGTDSLGRLASETLTVVSTADAAAGRGNIAFASISSITVRLTVLSTAGITGLAAAQHQICIGSSDKIGFANDISTESDVYHVIEAGVNTVTSVINAIYDTITFSSAPNGSDEKQVWYKQQYNPQR